MKKNQPGDYWVLPLIGDLNGAEVVLLDVPSKENHAYEQAWL